MPAPYITATHRHEARSLTVSNVMAFGSHFNIYRVTFSPEENSRFVLYIQPISNKPCKNKILLILTKSSLSGLYHNTNPLVNIYSTISQPGSQCTLSKFSSESSRGASSRFSRSFSTSNPHALRHGQPCIQWIQRKQIVFCTHKGFSHGFL